MKTVKVTFSNNDFLITGINGTNQEIQDYYRLGRTFNLGVESDLMVSVTRLEFIK